MSGILVEWEEGTPSLGRSVVAMGVFDGVHIGHQTLVRHAVDLAREKGATAVAATFDRDPDQVVTPDRAAPQLLPLSDKIDLLAALGVDTVLVFPFCMRMAATPPERFLDDILFEAVEPAALVVGHDFRFGQHASGTVATLERYGAVHGFEVVAYPLVEVDGTPVTSTRIRAEIAAGHVEFAATLLGRPHRVSGTVVHGRGAGGPELGVPTANVTPDRFAAIPAAGVYAGRAIIAAEEFPAAISVGVPPSYTKARDYLEAHLIGFSGDIYAETLTLEFTRHLRDQRVFSDPAELTAAMHRDIERVLESE